MRRLRVEIHTSDPQPAHFAGWSGGGDGDREPAEVTQAGDLGLGVLGAAAAADDDDLVAVEAGCGEEGDLVLGGLEAGRDSISTNSRTSGAALVP